MKIKQLLYFLCPLFAALSLQAQITPFEADPHSNTTVTYDQLQDYYRQILKDRKTAKLFEIGATDVGKPLQLIVLSKDGDFDPKSIKAKGKAVMFINNGIHPGEPEGIDASMMFVRDLLKNDLLADDVVLCLIPVYNISGMLDRGTTRANQNGPAAYGFRGSRQHYDLNRDFIKADSRNALLFNKVFNLWDPDVFFDTHTSNGADYQFVMTLIETHPDKLQPKLARFMKENVTNVLYEKMRKAGYPMVRYVNTKGETPESGLVSFLDGARYSTGYASLHHTIGYMPETHMWKPYKQRVESTYELMKILYENTQRTAPQIVKLRKEVKEEIVDQEEFVLSWKLDTSEVKDLTFLGFESSHKKSEVTGDMRLFYDRSKPFKKVIRYYSSYLPTAKIQKPKAYILPQGYDKLVELLKINGVNMSPLQADSVVDVQMYYITDYKTSTRSYEGHYPHSNVIVNPVMVKQQYYKGDWIISTRQQAIKYIVETLEPQATDSFFTWNYFDGILAQKEYFSAYIFEDYASELLKRDSELNRAFQQAKRENPGQMQNARAQLEWIYKKSPFYEKSFNLYPVGRILN